MCYGGDGSAGAARAQSYRQQSQLLNTDDYINSVFQGGTGTAYTPNPVDANYDPNTTYYRQNNKGVFIPWKHMTPRSYKVRAKSNSVLTSQNYNEAGFNDAFYDQRKQDYVNYYMPQFQKQLADTQKSTFYNLADRGVADSSIANDTISNLNRTANTQQNNIINQGQQAASSLKAQMNAAQTSLLGSSANAADPASSRANALTTASQFTTPSVWTPLMTNLFSMFSNASLPSASNSSTGSPTSYGFGSNLSNVIPSNY